MGIQLTVAEKIRAATGPWQELARLFVDDFPTIYSLMKDRARAKDFQLTLSCFSQILEVMHPTASNGIPMLKTNHIALPKFVKNTGAVDDGIKSHLANVWRTFKNLLEADSDTFTNTSKYLRGVQTFAPVEMVAVAVLISMYSDTRNIDLLLGDIRALRQSLREHFVDLRLNAPVWRFAWAYIDDLEAHRGAVDNSVVTRKSPIRRPGPSASNSAVVVPPSSSSSRPASTMTATIAGPSQTSSKGKVPVRASHPSVPIPETLPAIKQESRATTPSLATRRPSKRQRTNSAPSITQPPILNPSNNLVSTAPASPSQTANQTPRVRPSPTQTRFTRKVGDTLLGATSLSTISPSTTNGSLLSSSQAATRTSASGILPPDISNNAAPPAGTPVRGSNIPWGLDGEAGGELTRQTNRCTEPEQTDAAKLKVVPGQDSPAMLLRGLQMRVSDQDNSLAPTTPTNLATQAKTISPIPPALQNSQSNARQHSNRKWKTPQPFRFSDGLSKAKSVPADAASNKAAELQGATKSTFAQPDQSMLAYPTANIIPMRWTTPLTSSPGRPKKRKPAARPTPVELEGAIDLTSDGELEQERQDLLSSFKGRSSAKKIAKPTPIEHSLFIEENEALEEQSPAMNKPYAHLRKVPN